MSDIREDLRFVPPPGPPDPPPSHATVKACPDGHPLLWVSNSVAVCDTPEATLYPLWELVIRNGRRKLEAVTTPAALTLAHAIRELLNLTDRGPR